MLNWCTEHPWMTFFIVIAGLNVVGTVLKYLICGVFKIQIIEKETDDTEN